MSHWKQDPGAKRFHRATVAENNRSDSFEYQSSSFLCLSSLPPLLHPVQLLTTMSVVPSKSRLLALAKVPYPSPFPSCPQISPLSPSSTRSNNPQLQSTLFNTTFNPQRLRLGNSVLRKRLIGPIVQQYYPRQSASLQDMLKFFEKRFDLVGENEEEEDRLENVAIAKLRGKGAPKKKREKVEKRRFGGKKK
jgi:small subunit ribosomal protein S33